MKVFIPNLCLFTFLIMKKAWSYAYCLGGTGIPKETNRQAHAKREHCYSCFFFKLPVYQDKKANALYFFVKICSEYKNIF